MASALQHKRKHCEFHLTITLYGVYFSNRKEEIMDFDNLPKCQCGADVGLSIHDNRVQCSDCLWNEIKRLQTIIDTQEAVEAARSA